MVGLFLALGYLSIGSAIWLGTGGIEASKEHMRQLGLTKAEIIKMDIMFILTWPMGLIDQDRG